MFQPQRTPHDGRERTTGDIGLSSGWQGDKFRRDGARPNSDYAIVPVAQNPIVPRSPPCHGAHLNAAGKKSQA